MRPSTPTPLKRASALSPQQTRRHESAARKRSSTVDLADDSPYRKKYKTDENKENSGPSATTVEQVGHMEFSVEIGRAGESEFLIRVNEGSTITAIDSRTARISR
jgi:hypothetical protein